MAKQILLKGFQPFEIESFLKELAWRDYFQQVWIAKGEQLNTDLKQVQSKVSHFEIPISIVTAQTGIEAIDVGIQNLYQTGYMHNHVRM